MTYNVPYSPGVARFVGLVKSKKGFMSSGGSGSGVMTNDFEYNPVGLLFALNPDGTGYFSPITPILTRFGATICSEP